MPADSALSVLWQLQLATKSLDDLFEFYSMAKCVSVQGGVAA